MNEFKIDENFISTLGITIYPYETSTIGKVIINNVEVTDIESWNKALSTFSELQTKIEAYKNERDTYKRLAEEYIKKYNKEKEKNKRAINRISIVRMDNDTTTDTHNALDYILKSLIGE